MCTKALANIFSMRHEQIYENYWKYLQIRKNIIKAAVEGERKLNKHLGAVGKRNDPNVMKHNWVVERPRISWDFYSDTSIALHQSMPYKKFILLARYLCPTAKKENKLSLCMVYMFL